MAPNQAKPDHYSRLSPQPIEVTEAWGWGFHLGSVLKYMARAGHVKSELPSMTGYRELRDLKAAAWYLQRHIELREAAINGTLVSRPPDQL